MNNNAFVFIKPHANTAEVQQLVKETFQARGIVIKKEGTISGPEIDTGMLIDQHYYAIASKATILSPHQMPVPPGKFEEGFGISWESALNKGLVYNALGACNYLGVDAAALDELWTKCIKANKRIKLGGGFYCGLIEGVPNKHPIYTFNAFFMSLRSKYVSTDASIRYYDIEFNKNNISWSDFRGKVLGPTDPANAPPDSLRGKIFQHWQALGLPGPPDTGDNGVHGSASPFEGLVERMNWLNIPLEDDAFGSKLLHSGIPTLTIREWSMDPQIQGKGLFDSLEDTDVDECLTRCISKYQATVDHHRPLSSSSLSRPPSRPSSVGQVKLAPISASPNQKNNSSSQNAKQPQGNPPSPGKSPPGLDPVHVKQSPRLPSLTSSGLAKLPILPAELLLISPRLPNLSTLPSKTLAPILITTTPAVNSTAPSSNQSPNSEPQNHASSQNQTPSPKKFTCMEKYTMPMLLVNMASELVFILDRRLKDQQADPQHIKIVLTDFIKAMLTSEIMEPRNLVTYEETIDIFERLLHKTPMHLNKQSVDALFTIMIGILKYQLLSCSSPSSYLQVTENHLDILKALVPTPEIEQIVDGTLDHFLKTYGYLTAGNWYQIKIFVFRYLESHKSKKIAALVQSNKQLQDGTVVLPHGGMVPKGTEVPGVVRYFDQGVQIRTLHLKVPLAASSMPWDGNYFANLGFNIWSTEYAHSNHTPRKKKQHSISDRKIKEKHDIESAKKRLSMLKSRSSSVTGTAGTSEHGIDSEEAAKHFMLSQSI